MHTVISIDWDFFLWRGLEARDPYLDIRLPGQEDVERIPALHLFDWGHSETHGPRLQARLWESRWVDFVLAGIDPRAIAGVREEFGGVRPEAFVAALRDRLHLGSAEVLLADSHKWGYPSATYAARLLPRDVPVRVLHFDAHHDLGYSNRVHEEARCGEVTCDSWLYHALRQNVVSEVVVIYPDWRDRECESTAQEHLQGYVGRIRTTTWAEWLREARDEAFVPVINVARSSAWTPPWFDGDFDAFVRLLGHNRRCLDCEFRRKIRRGHNACKARRWEEPTDLIEAERKLRARAPDFVREYWDTTCLPDGRVMPAILPRPL